MYRAHCAVIFAIAQLTCVNCNRSNLTVKTTNLSLAYQDNLAVLREVARSVSSSLASTFR